MPSARAVASASRPRSRAQAAAAEAADRAGRVKAEIVVSRAHRRADPAGGLVTGDKRRDHLAPAAAALLGEGEKAGQDRDRWMTRHRQVDVVVIERMARGAVDQRGRQYRQPDRMPDQACLRGAAGFGQLVEQDPDKRIVGAGERDAVIVEHALPGQFAHRLGQRIV